MRRKRKVKRIWNSFNGSMNAEAMTKHIVNYEDLDSNIAVSAATTNVDRHLVY